MNTAGDDDGAARSTERIPSADADAAAAWKGRLEHAELLARMGSVELDLRDRTVVWSPGLYRILETCPEKTSPSGPEFMRRVHPDDLLRVTELQQKAISGRLPSVDVTMRLVVNGRVKWVSGRSETTFAQEGTPLYNFSYLQDVTEQVESAEARTRAIEELARARDAADAANQRLAESNRRLEELEAMRDDLAHMMAHDMRSPIMGIATLLHNLRQEVAHGPYEDYAADLDEALACTVRLEQMVANFLDLRRLEVARMPIDLRARDLGALVHDALRSIGRLLADRRVDVVGERPSVEALCDAALTRRVIVNLVWNAVKHTPKGAAIRVELATTDERAVVRVRDEGRGIPPDKLPLLFEKFGPLAGAPASIGLGLAFSKLAIEAQGGRIGVESEVGRGSTFSFELPQPPGAP